MVERLTADEWLTVIYALQDYAAEHETGPARVEAILAKLPSEDALIAEAWRAEGYDIAPDGSLTRTVEGKPRATVIRLATMNRAARGGL